MTKAVTSPPEWRRRARLAESVASGEFPPAPMSGQDASGGWVGPSGRVEMGATALGGWAALDAGDDDAAARAGHLCRRWAWDQPDDVAGLLVGWDDGPAEPLVRPHAADQPYGDIGAAVVLLARLFEERGEADDLEAAIELHDVVVAMGEGVWEPANALVGWGGATLYEVTGEDAFLATAERMADVLTETQMPDGSWGDPASDAVLTGMIGAALAAMADAVEARVDVEQTLADADDE